MEIQQAVLKSKPYILRHEFSIRLTTPPILLPQRDEIPFSASLLPAEGKSDEGKYQREQKPVAGPM
jgi:hypothetical protein